MFHEFGKEGCRFATHSAFFAGVLRMRRAFRGPVWSDLAWSGLCPARSAGQGEQNAPGVRGKRLLPRRGRAKRARHSRETPRPERHIAKRVGHSKNRAAGGARATRSRFPRSRLHRLTRFGGVRDGAPGRAFLGRPPRRHHPWFCLRKFQCARLRAQTGLELRALTTRSGVLGSACAHTAAHRFTLSLDAQLRAESPLAPPHITLAVR